MRLILALCLFALPLLAQNNPFADPATVAQWQPFVAAASADNYYPTNIGAGYYPVFVYDADSISGATVASWPDYAGSGYALTNTVSKGPDTASAALNGHNTALFNGTDRYMRAGQPDVPVAYEVMMVARLTNGANKYFFHTANTPRVQLLTAGGGNIQLDAGGVITGAAASWSEKFMVWNFQVSFHGTNGFVATNGVLLHAAGVRPTGSQTNEFGNASWSLGAYFFPPTTVGGYSGIDVAWIGLYPTNLATTGVRGDLEAGSVRSNLFNWLTNRYALAP